MQTQNYDITTSESINITIKNGDIKDGIECTSVVLKIFDNMIS